MALKTTGSESGQAVLEYILMLSIIAFFYMIVVGGLAKTNADQKILQPITGDFARAYRYGHVKAKGYEDGGPENHALARDGKGSFRIFLNPYLR